MNRGAIVFDRDGVLNRDVGYASRRDQIEWCPDAMAAVAAVNAAGLLALVATNQSGVARGFYDEAAVVALHGWMARELAKAGARIDGFAYCPHHPEAVLEAYRRECRRRKPAPGMILDLIRDYKADPRRTLMIGDTDTDRRAAEAAGIGFRLYQGGSLLHLVQTVVPVLATDASALR